MDRADDIFKIIERAWSFCIPPGRVIAVSLNDYVRPVSAPGEKHPYWSAVIMHDDGATRTWRFRTATESEDVIVATFASLSRLGRQ